MTIRVDWRGDKETRLGVFRLLSPLLGHLSNDLCILEVRPSELHSRVGYRVEVCLKLMQGRRGIEDQVNERGFEEKEEETDERTIVRRRFPLLLLLLPLSSMPIGNQSFRRLS